MSKEQKIINNEYISNHNENIQTKIDNTLKTDIQN